MCQSSSVVSVYCRGKIAWVVICPFHAKVEFMDSAGDRSDAIQEWLTKLSSCDDAAFAEARQQVIQLTSDRLETLARKMLRGFPRLRRWEQTGDVLQNAVLRLHEALVSIRPDSVRQFFGLATTQIRRELIDLSRHHFGPEGGAANHHTDDYQQSQNDQSAVDAAPDHSGEPRSLAEWSDFHDAVKRLPEQEREVFDLHWYQGLDQKTVATILGVTARTIKSRWRNAKLLLRQILDHRDG